MVSELVRFRGKPRWVSDTLVVTIPKAYFDGGFVSDKEEFEFYFRRLTS